MDRNSLYPKEQTGTKANSFLKIRSSVPNYAPSQQSRLWQGYISALGSSYQKEQDTIRVNRY